MFGELLTIVAERLNADEYFAGSGLRVHVDNQGDFVSAIDESMELGMLLVVSIDNVTRDASEGIFTVELRLTGTEDVLKNRDPGGSGKALGDVLEAAIRIVCDGEWTAGDVWSGFEFSPLTQTELKDSGMITRAIQFKTTTTSINT